MGQARERKSRDPSYGRSKRGLIISPPIEIEGSRLSARSSGIDPQELRVSLLLWDKLVWPSSRAIYFASGPDEQFLERAGILSRPDYTVWGDGAQGIASGQIKAFNEFDSREPGVWALAQGEDSLMIKGGYLSKGENAQLELIRAIPVPNRDVPLAEILEFKRKRDSEFQALRAEIDSLAFELSAAESWNSTLASHKVKIDNACADAVKIGSEWKFPVRLANFKSTYELRPIQTFVGAISGLTGSSIFNLDLTQSALGAVAGAALASTSIIKLTFDGFKWKGIRPRQGPYRYVYQINQELF